MMRRAQTKIPRPFLKWVGGKGQLLPELSARIAKAGEFGRYHEPFVGGGAFFFEIYRAKLLGRKKAYLSDANPNLVETYQAIKENVEAVILQLEQHQARHGKEHYYEIRAVIPETLVARAARIIYLNRTCFNGLYRENSRGLFNVPMGDYKNPRIVDADNLRAVAGALAKTELHCDSFDVILQHAKSKDFVYFDPPYHPVSTTSSFTSYAKGGFDQEDQVRLADVAKQLSDKGVKVLLSNSHTPFICDLYRDRGFSVSEVFATRNVNSRADRRGKVSEVLARNF